MHDTYMLVSIEFVREFRTVPSRRDRRHCIHADRVGICNCDTLFAKNANPIQRIPSNCCMERRRPIHGPIYRAPAHVGSPISPATPVLVSTPPRYYSCSLLFSCSLFQLCALWACVRVIEITVIWHEKYFCFFYLQSKMLNRSNERKTNCK